VPETSQAALAIFWAIVGLRLPRLVVLWGDDPTSGAFVPVFQTPVQSGCLTVLVLSVVEPISRISARAVIRWSGPASRWSWFTARSSAKSALARACSIFAPFAAALRSIWAIMLATTTRIVASATINSTDTSTKPPGCPGLAGSDGSGANFRAVWNGRATVPVAALPGKTSGTLVLLWRNVAPFGSDGKP